MCASVLQWRAHAMKDCVASLHQSQAQAEVHDQLLRHVEDAQGRHHGHTELLVLLDGQRVPLLLELLVGKILHCTERKTTATERKTCKPPTLIKPPRFTRSGLVTPLGPYSYRCIACGKCAWMSKTHNENELPHFFKKKKLSSLPEIIWCWRPGERCYSGLFHFGQILQTPNLTKKQLLFEKDFLQVQSFWDQLRHFGMYMVIFRALILHHFCFVEWWEGCQNYSPLQGS